MTTPHPTELTDAERVRLWALADAATPGPWRFTHGMDARWMVLGDNDLTVKGEGYPDGEFIAAARTAVPALLAENQRLREGVEALADEMGDGGLYDTGLIQDRLRALLSTSSVRGEGDE